MLYKIICCLLVYCNFTIAQLKELMIDSSDVVQEDLLEDVLSEESPIADLLEPEIEKIGEHILSKPSLNVRSRIIKKLQKSRGYEENIFLGNPIYSYQRFRLGNKIFEGALLIKKDPGERSYSEFTNYYLQMNNLFNIKKLIFGDYIIEAGQGLCFWRNYYYSKGVSFHNTIIRNGKELQAYNSSDEIGFMRGLATHIGFNNFEMLAFYSIRSLTASIDTNGYVNNFYSPYFRTTRDLLRKNNTKEKVLGARIFSKSANNKVGFTISKVTYSRIVKRINTNNILNIGVDFWINLNALSLSAESFLNNMKYMNSIMTLKFNPLRSLTYVISHRNYSRFTFNRFATPFGEGNGNNEIGFFNGVNWKFNEYFSLIGYADLFKSYPSETMNFQRSGREYFFQINTKVAKRMDCSFRYRNKVYDEQTNTIDNYGRKIKVYDLYSRHSLRYNFDYRINSNVKYRLRFEYLILNSEYQKVKEYGKLLYHDINYKMFTYAFINFRITFFSTSSYKSGISTYENDLEGVLTNPVLFGRGIKWYLIIKCKIKEKFSISLKYSYLIREDVNKIGSGWDQLPSNVDNRVALQVDINL